VALTGGDIELP